MPSHPNTSLQFPLYWGVLKRSAKAAKRTLSRASSSLSRAGSAAMRRYGGVWAGSTGCGLLRLRVPGPVAALLQPALQGPQPACPPPRLPPHSGTPLQP